MPSVWWNCNSGWPRVKNFTFHQDDITFVGDAIEVRLNAWHEDLSPVLGGVVLQTPPRACSCARTARAPRCRWFAATPPAWIVPSYDANFALLIVTGSERHETLTRLIAILEEQPGDQGQRRTQDQCATHPGLADSDARLAARNGVPHRY